MPDSPGDHRRAGRSPGGRCRATGNRLWAGRESRRWSGGCSRATASRSQGRRAGRRWSGGCCRATASRSQGHRAGCRWSGGRCRAKGSCRPAVRGAAVRLAAPGRAAGRELARRILAGRQRALSPAVGRVLLGLRVLAAGLTAGPGLRRGLPRLGALRVRCPATATAGRGLGSVVPLAATAARLVGARDARRRRAAPRRAAGGVRRRTGGAARHRAVRPDGVGHGAAWAGGVRHGAAWAGSAGHRAAWAGARHADAGVRNAAGRPGGSGTVGNATARERAPGDASARLLGSAAAAVAGSGVLLAALLHRLAAGCLRAPRQDARIVLGAAPLAGVRVAGPVAGVRLRLPGSGVLAPVGDVRVVAVRPATSGTVRRGARAFRGTAGIGGGGGAGRFRVRNRGCCLPGRLGPAAASPAGLLRSSARVVRRGLDVAGVGVPGPVVRLPGGRPTRTPGRGGVGLRRTAAASAGRLFRIGGITPPGGPVVLADQVLGVLDRGSLPTGRFRPLPAGHADGVLTGRLVGGTTAPGVVGPLPGGRRGGRQLPGRRGRRGGAGPGLLDGSGGPAGLVGPLPGRFLRLLAPLPRRLLWFASLPGRRRSRGLLPGGSLRRGLLPGRRLRRGLLPGRRLGRRLLPRGRLSRLLLPGRGGLLLPGRRRRVGVGVRGRPGSAGDRGLFLSGVMSSSLCQASVVERQTCEPVDDRHSVVCRQRAPVARHSEV